MNDQPVTPPAEEPQDTQDKPEIKPFTPELLKRPNFQPPKFKYVPPKAGKRHF